MIELIRLRFLPMAAIASLGAIAGAGLVPLWSLGNDQPPRAESESASKALSLVAPEEVVPIESGQPQIEGITDSIAQVLTAGGFLSRVDHRSLMAELSPSIVRVLEAEDSVVTVMEPEATP